MGKRKKQNQPLRDRTQELVRVPAARIEGASWNWRVHGKAQQAALAGAIEELGFLQPLLVRPLGEGRYQLIDGHLRQDLIAHSVGPDTPIPCVVLDLDETEARKANLTLDPLAAMAEANKGKLDLLLQEVQTDDKHLAAMLDTLAQEHGLVPPEGGDGKPPPDTSAQLEGLCFKVIVECAGEREQGELIARLEGEGFRCHPLMS